MNRIINIEVRDIEEEKIGLDDNYFLYFLEKEVIKGY